MIKKRFSIVAIMLTTFFLKGTAQEIATSEKLKTIDLSAKQLTPNNISYVNYSTEKKEILLTFLDSVQLHVVPVSYNFEKMQDSLTYTFPNEGYTIQNTVISKNAIEYLVKNNKENLSVLKYDFKTKQWVFGNNLVKDNEHYLCSALFQNKIYLFNYDRNGAVIKAYIVTTEGSTLYNDFSVADFKLGDNNFDFFFKKKKKPLKVINSDSPVELFASIKHKKMYQFGEKINIAIEDTLSHAVGLLQLNLKTKKQNIHYYASEKTGCEKLLFVNSAMSKNYLAVFTGCLEQAKLSVWDLNSTKIIKTSNFSKNELITIKNYDNLISPKQALSIEKLKPIVLLQNFSNKNAALYIKENDNNLALLVGFSHLKKNKLKQAKRKGAGGGNGNGGGNGTGGGRQRKLLQEKRRQVNGYGLSKSYSNYETSRPQFFVANLNLKNKQFETTATFDNTFEKIKVVKQSLNKKILPGNQLIISVNNELWYAYVANNKQQMIFLKME